MSLRVKDPGTVPGEGWHFPVQATGFDVRATSYDQLYSFVLQHCTVNGVSAPSEADVISWICANLTISCYEGPTAFINRFSQGLPAQVRQGCCGQKVVNAGL